MSDISFQFISYNLSSSKGSINLKDYLILSNTFYVPLLHMNLLFICLINEQQNCVTTFYLH